MKYLARAARIAFTFVMMNYAAVAGLFAAAREAGRAGAGSSSRDATRARRPGRRGSRR